MLENVRGFASDKFISYRRDLMEQLEINLELQSNATVQAYPKLLEQAVRMLISHAMKYSSMNRSIDGISFKAPWYMRLFGRFVKRRFLKRGLPPGFKLPKDTEAAAYPAVASPQEALAILHQAVARLRNEKATVPHPVFGRLTHEEWTQFHLRHAELHLSFAVLS